MIHDVLQMRRLLGRQPRTPQPPKRSRQLLLKALFGVTAFAVTAFISWACFHSSAFQHGLPAANTVSTSADDGVDYGHIATLELADDTFATDGWLSQLQTHLHTNKKLVGNTWQEFNAGHNSTCPIVYNRLKYSEIRRFRQKPYLLGGARQPECINCQNVGVWENTCQYLDHGPVCPKKDQMHFWHYLVNRAEAGAPGYEAMLTMTPCDLWPYIQGRTLWVAGDSISQEFMRALQCFMMEFWDMTVHDIKGEYMAGEALDDFREKVLGGWCVHLPEDTRLCHVRVNFPGEMVRVLPDFEKMTMKKSDIVLFNVGLWLNDPEQYTNEMREFVEYYREHKARLPFFLWRDSSVQHFNTPTGNFHNEPASWDCLPLGTQLSGKGAISVDDDNVVHRQGPEELEVVLEGGWRNKAARPIMHQLGIPQIEIWNKTVPVWRYHHHYHENPEHNDCTHWCHPSPYQMWIYDTLLMLRQVYADVQKHAPTNVPGRFNFLSEVEISGDD